jgi:hypothetical protein
MQGNRINITNEHSYEPVSKLVETRHEGNVIILWTQYVPTNRTILNNKLDIIIYDNKKRRCVTIGVAISEGRNVIKKDSEKILKYNKDITI